MGIENEHAISEEKKGYSYLEKEFETSIKEMKSLMATGSDELPIQFSKALDGDGKQILIDLCNFFIGMGNGLTISEKQ